MWHGVLNQCAAPSTGGMHTPVHVQCNLQATKQFIVCNYWLNYTSVKITPILQR